MGRSPCGSKNPEARPKISGNQEGRRTWHRSNALDSNPPQRRQAVSGACPLDRTLGTSSEAISPTRCESWVSKDGSSAPSKPSAPQAPSGLATDCQTYGGSSSSLSGQTDWRNFRTEDRSTCAFGLDEHAQQTCRAVTQYL